MNKKKWITLGISVLAVVIAVLVVIFIVIPGNRYKNAVQLMQNGDYTAAAMAFAAMGDYKDAPTKVNQCNYLYACKLEADGRKALAAMTFGALGDYKDARTKSFSLWNTIAARRTYSIESHYMLAIDNEGNLIAQTRSGDKGVPLQKDTSHWKDLVAVSSGEFDFAALKSDGTVLTYSYDNNEANQWTDIVDIDYTDGTLVGLKSDGTVLYKPDVEMFENKRGQDAVEGWRGIVDIACTDNFTVGLRADGTVVMTGYAGGNAEEIATWTDIVAIDVETCVVVGLKADGTVVVSYTGGTNEYSEVENWTDIVAIDVSLKGVAGLKSDGTAVYCGEDPVIRETVPQWQDLAAVQAEFVGAFGLTKDGKILRTDDRPWYEPLEDWSNIRQPAVDHFDALDPDIPANVASEKSEVAFTNKFGTATTVCAHAGCNNYIANSGDTNCCTVHSNRCGNCSRYIDEDAMYCMTCLENALS